MKNLLLIVVFMMNGLFWTNASPLGEATEAQLTECNPKCQNNGTCDLVTLKCFCPVDYTGQNCESKVLDDESTALEPIVKGGKSSGKLVLEFLNERGEDKDLEWVKQFLNKVNNNQNKTPGRKCQKGNKHCKHLHNHQHHHFHYHNNKQQHMKTTTTAPELSVVTEAIAATTAIPVAVDDGQEEENPIVDDNSTDVPQYVEVPETGENDENVNEPEEPVEGEPDQNNNEDNGETDDGSSETDWENQDHGENTTEQGENNDENQEDPISDNENNENVPDEHVEEPSGGDDQENQDENQNQQHVSEEDTGNKKVINIKNCIYIYKNNCVQPAQPQQDSNHNINHDFHEEYELLNKILNILINRQQMSSQNNCVIGKMFKLLKNKICPY